jgi:colicin import membrane protein
VLILNGVSYSDTDFYLQQKEYERGWYKPIAFALAFHLMVFACSVTLPEILHRKPILDDIVTVNLVSLPEIQEQTPASEASPPETSENKPAEIKKIEPEKAKVQITEVPVVIPEKTTPVRPVSLKPLKRKVQKTDPEKLAREKADEQRERERLAALARAKQEEERARLAAEEARSALAAMIRQKGVKQTASSTRPSGGAQVQSIVEKNYYSALYDQVQRYWILPDMKQWDGGLETVVVLTILRDGSVAKQVIEKKSNDPFFDQFVMKTLESALPMPRFPSLMPQQSIEVGLRFRPGELLM